MTLRDSIISDATTVFLQTDEFAETVTYYPDRYFGEAERADRPIAAQVIRRPIQVITGDGDTATLHVWEVTVANNSTDGILRSELAEGRDQLGITPIGGVEERRTIMVVSDTEDVGMFTFECN